MLFIYELKKQLEKPFFYIVLAACVLFNLLVTLSNTYQLQQIAFEEKTAEALGSPFVTETAVQALTDEEQREFAAAYIGGGIDPTTAENILTKVISVNAFRLDDDCAELALSTAVPILEARLNEINENSELCAMNGGEALFRTLFSGMLLLCAIEGVVFALLITAKAAAHEFSEGTAQTIYCTRKGRTLAMVKLLASVTLSLLFFSLLCLLCYAIFFIISPCPALLGAPMNVISYGLIVIPWHGISVMGYLLQSVALTALLIIVFSLLQYVLSCFIRNPIIAVMISLALWVSVFAPSFFISGKWLWRLLWYSLPPVLLFNTPGNWLACSNRSIAIPDYAMISMLVWAAIAAVGCLIAIKRLKRANIF